MECLDFFSKLDSMEDKAYIETFLVYNVSLVLAKVKPAVTITIKKDDYKIFNSFYKFGSDFIATLDLKYIELRESVDSIIIMVYDASILKSKLASEAAKAFLSNIGYPSKELAEDYVLILKSRYEKYHCPHELGLFLGIPLKDVQDFMDCSRKKCLLCGYWKVYNDSIEAAAIFNMYDEIKAFTIKAFLKGHRSHTLALSIKNSFAA